MTIHFNYQSALQHFLATSEKTANYQSGMRIYNKDDVRALADLLLKSAGLMSVKEAGILNWPAKAIKPLLNSKLTYALGLPLASTYGASKFIYPKIREDAKGVWNEVSQGTGILATEAQQKAMNELEKFNDRLSTSGEKVLAGAGEHINNFVDTLNWTGKELAAQTALGGGATLGWLGARGLLKDKKSKRMREAERYRNREYQRLHYDAAKGNVPPDTFSNKEEEIDKTVGDKERMHLTDYAIPAALLAAGTGAGYLGYRGLKG